MTLGTTVMASTADSQRYRGRVTIITGGASGIGLGILRVFGKGLTVYIKLQAIILFLLVPCSKLQS